MNDYRKSVNELLRDMNHLRVDARSLGIESILPLLLDEYFEDPDLLEIARMKYDEAKLSVLSHGCIQPDTSQDISGDIYLGNVEGTQQPVGLNIDEMTRGISLSGSSGSGKTTLQKTLASQVAKHKPVWIFSSNREYRDLKPQFNVLRWDKLRTNPFCPPPGIEPEEWAGIIATILSQAVGLLEASRSLLIESIVALYRLYDSKNTNIWPNLPDVRDYIKQNKPHIMSREATYRSATLNRINAILSTSRDVYNCSLGHSAQELADKNIIWELDGMFPEMESFYVHSMLFWQFYNRLANGKLECGLHHLIMIDEAQRLLSRQLERRTAEGVPLISMLLSQVRKTGIGLVIAAQSPSMLVTAALENTATKLVFRLGSGQDIREVASGLRLRQQQQDLLTRLEVGQCILHMPRYPYPFLIRVPEFEG